MKSNSHSQNFSNLNIFAEKKNIVWEYFFGIMAQVAIKILHILSISFVTRNTTGYLENSAIEWKIAIIKMDAFLLNLRA